MEGLLTIPESAEVVFMWGRDGWSWPQIVQIRGEMAPDLVGWWGHPVQGRGIDGHGSLWICLGAGEGPIYFLWNSRYELWEILQKYSSQTLVSAELIQLFMHERNIVFFLLFCEFEGFAFVFWDFLIYHRISLVSHFKIMSLVLQLNIQNFYWRMRCYEKHKNIHSWKMQCFVSNHIVDWESKITWIYISFDTLKTVSFQKLH